MRIYVTSKDCSRKEVSVQDGMRLSDALKSAGFYIPASCGGSLACSTCHVMLDAGSFSRTAPASVDEEDVLDMLPQVSATSRLSCQIHCDESMVDAEVRIPDAITNLLSK